MAVGNGRSASGATSGGGGGSGSPGTVDADAQLRKASEWQARIRVLRMEDWDRRVRIGAGNFGGARVGSVAEVPPLGVKLALRNAMISQAEAELALAETRVALERLRTRRLAAGSIWFVAGVGATVLFAYMTDVLFG